MASNVYEKVFEYFCFISYMSPIVTTILLVYKNGVQVLSLYTREKDSEVTLSFR